MSLSGEFRFYFEPNQSPWFHFHVCAYTEIYSAELVFEPSNQLDKKYAVPIDRIRFRSISKRTWFRVRASIVFNKVKAICHRLPLLFTDPL